MICVIWKTPAVVDRDIVTDADYSIIDSFRAGGKYRISGSDAATDLLDLTPSEKARLTTWIVDQHRAGVAVPTITTNVVQQTEMRQPMSFSTKIDRFFELFGRKAHRIGQIITIHRPSDSDIGTEARDQFCAWTEMEDGSELLRFTNLLVAEGLLKDPFDLHLTAQGYSRLDAIRAKLPSTTQAFVAMWFDESLSDAYINGIIPALKACGYKAMRIDGKEHSNKICDEMVAEIKLSRFMVADFTCSYELRKQEKIENARGNVYFEAGFAQGLNIPVIWTCREDCIDIVHFDIQQYGYVVWKDVPNLRKGLRDRIINVVGYSPSYTVEDDQEWNIFYG